MSACEKCWRDAHRPGRDASVADEYRRLLNDRVGDKACTPEQQAGPDGKLCMRCGGYTLHQYTGECMAGCKPWPVKPHPPQTEERE